uniref:Uncharacterized protein n=1 Tax=Cacopsylla melanoneura TaxID=428564 RepID=A0A8D8WS27_9HEMI
MAPPKKYTVEELVQNDEICEKLAVILADKMTPIFEAKLEAMSKKISQLEQENRKLKNRVVDLEQYGRRNNVRLFGIPEDSKENTTETVIQVVKRNLGINISRADVDACHRVGKGTKQKPRGIICRFVSRLVRDDVFSKKKLAGTKMSIKEDLTRERMALYKKISEKFDFRSVWTLRGNIHLLYKKKKIVFTTEDEYEEWLTLEKI